MAANLAQLLAESVEELGVDAVNPLDPLVPATGGSSGTAASAGTGGKGGKAAADGGTAIAADDSGCSCSAPGVNTGRAPPSGVWALGLAFALGLRRIRKSS